MNNNTLLKSIFWLFFALFFSLSLIVNVFANNLSLNRDDNRTQENKKNSAIATPEGFKGFAIMMATGLIDPSVNEPRPGITGCYGVFCDGEFFHKNIMHRSALEIEEIKNQSKIYFYEQFGIDVDDPQLIDRIEFISYMGNPDLQYRVYAFSGEQVSENGWIIRDGGFRLAITDPGGIVLGGKNSGILANQGSMMFFGNFNILATNKYGNLKKEILIFFKSINVSDALAGGGFHIRARMFNGDLGEGLGLNSAYLIPQENGLIRANIRNILTFPSESTQTEFPSKPDYAASLNK